MSFVPRTVDFAEAGDGAGIDGEGHVHDVGGIVHHGIAADRLGEGMAEGPEAVDDLRLAGEHRGRAGRHLVVDPGEARRQHSSAKGAAAGIADTDRSEGCRAARPRPTILTGTRARARDASAARAAATTRGLARQRHAVDADRDAALVVAVAARARRRGGAGRPRRGAPGPRRPAVPPGAAGRATRYPEGRAGHRRRRRPETSPSRAGPRRSAPGAPPPSRTGRTGRRRGRASGSRSHRRGRRRGARATPRPRTIRCADQRDGDRVAQTGAERARRPFRAGIIGLLIPPPSRRRSSRSPNQKPAKGSPKARTDQIRDPRETAGCGPESATADETGTRNLSLSQEPVRGGSLVMPSTAFDDPLTAESTKSSL